jgi:hypothetical protein
MRAWPTYGPLYPYRALSLRKFDKKLSDLATLKDENAGDGTKGRKTGEDCFVGDFEYDSIVNARQQHPRRSLALRRWSFFPIIWNTHLLYITYRMTTPNLCKEALEWREINLAKNVLGLCFWLGLGILTILYKFKRKETNSLNTIEVCFTKETCFFIEMFSFSIFH